MKTQEIKEKKVYKKTRDGPKSAAGCATSGIRPKNKLCVFDGCTTRANYNFHGQKEKLFCAVHKQDGMVDVTHPMCAYNGCMKVPYFNAPGERKGLYCSDHKEDLMVNVVSKQTCIADGCYVRPHFNFLGETRGLYCSKHREHNMVCVTNKECIYAQCGKTALYNVHGQNKAIYCHAHKTPEMVNVKHTKCAEPGCTTIPYYNVVGKKRGLFCSVHRKEGMVDVVSKLCAEPDCTKRPTFNVPGEKKGIFCQVHAKEGMVNVMNLPCIEDGCTKRPYYNFHGEKRAIYCSSHMKEGMVNVCMPKCKTGWCQTMVDQKNSKQEGYCIRCFVHLFPDKKPAFNFKTKERAVSIFLKETFPDLSWVLDSRVTDGCSRRRPDVLLDMGTHVLVVEVDENQHRDYDCSCENKRLMEISQDIGHRPLVFIRFNPDSYVAQNGQEISSPWKINRYGICGVTQKNAPHWSKRLAALKDQVTFWQDHITDKTIEVVQLFYDGSPML